MLPERLSIRQLEHPSGDLLELEIVERNGLGHLDTICDEIAERIELGTIPSLSLGMRRGAPP